MIHADTTNGKRARLHVSSMSEPMLTLDEADRLLGLPLGAVSQHDCDSRLRRAAQLLVGYRLKGFGLTVAYLRPSTP